MAKIKYNRVRGIKKILRESQADSSISDAMSAMHPILELERRRQKQAHNAGVRRAMDIIAR